MIQAMFSRARQTGQALVEFALAATLLFTLMAAAVDIGFIFLSSQELRVGAQEGATFGSYPLVFYTNQDVGATSIRVVERVDFNDAEIVERIRNSAGPRGTAGFVDFFDLNNDGVLDDVTALVNNARNDGAYIQIENLKDNGAGGFEGECATSVPRQDMRFAARGCFISVTVRYDYNFFFPLAPAFGNTFQLRSTVIMPVRSSFIG